MNIDKQIAIVLLFLFVSLFSFQISNASCTLQSLKECNKDGLRQLIVDIIKSRQSQPLPQNELSLEEMKGKLGEQVGGMKLDSIGYSDSKGSIGFIFTGKVVVNADFSNDAIPYIYSESDANRFNCYYNIDKDSLKKIPRLKGVVTEQDLLCLSDMPSKSEPANSYNADIEISQLVITVPNTEGVLSYKDNCEKGKYLYMSEIVVDKVNNKKTIKDDDLSTWRTFSYNIPGTEASFTVDIPPYYYKQPMNNYDVFLSHIKYIHTNCLGRGVGNSSISVRVIKDTRNLSLKEFYKDIMKGDQYDIGDEIVINNMKMQTFYHYLQSPVGVTRYGDYYILIEYPDLNNLKDRFHFYEGKLSEVKKIFKATEIISNVSGHVEFWTEAYCPDSGTYYDYDKNNLRGYIIDSCEQGETGSHGGCKTCIMSKLSAHKAISGEEQEKDINKGGISITPSDAKFYKVDKDKVMRQIYGNKKFSYEEKNGKDYIQVDDSPYPHIEKIILSNFTDPGKKEYLFVIMEYIGMKNYDIKLYLFDDKMRLLSRGADVDSTQLSAEVIPLHCKKDKLTYIFYSGRGCVNGGYCSDGGLLLLKHDGDKFAVVQNVLITSTDSMHTLKGNELMVYLPKGVDKSYVCDGIPGGACMYKFDIYENWKPLAFIYSHKLVFNEDTCEFEDTRGGLG